MVCNPDVTLSDPVVRFDTCLLGRAMIDITFIVRMSSLYFVDQSRHNYTYRHIDEDLKEAKSNYLSSSPRCRPTFLLHVL